MKFKISTAIITALIVFIFLGSSSAVEKDSTKRETDGLPYSINLHFTAKYCTECHEKKPGEGVETLLKFGGDFTQLCKCHGYTPGTYIHPVDIEPTKEKKSRIPADFPLVNGKIVCTTCHDIYQQCAGDPKRRLLNPKFLRGAPYPSRTTLCFKCHDENKYKMLDPHNQLDEEGEIIEVKCLYCHTKVPDVKKEHFKDVELVGDLVPLCQRCHSNITRHPAGQNHLSVPPRKILERMKALESQYGVVLPLDYEGKVTCATCHNPHERGVIGIESAGSRGAGEKFRHRLPINMCKACHGM
ncbi:MAG: hypothetical protein AMK70_11665 [Nitrospira bacterium SG8_35_1]|nr:MAG: hypothetical protein AMK70_11665 [Nitrospira bacterium SG8_35_1]